MKQRHALRVTLHYRNVRYIMTGTEGVLIAFSHEPPPRTDGQQIEFCSVTETLNIIFLKYGISVKYKS